MLRICNARAVPGFFLSSRIRSIGLKLVPSLQNKKSLPTTLRFSSSHDRAVKRENIWTVPNILTMTRLAAAPCIGYLVVHQHYTPALGLMIYASITDFVDGYLARKYKIQTIFGSIADPAADKALLVTLASCLSYSGAIPWWCGLAILGRDAGLALAAVIIRWKTLPAPKTMSRYFDASLPSVKITPTKISKWNTFFQMIYLSLCLANPVFSLLDANMTEMLAIPVTVTTIWSGVSYIFSRTAVRRL